MIGTKENAKKRLMYIQKEDYNYLTYNLLLVLKQLKANSIKSSFKDFRKIAYLVDFINTNPKFNSYDKSELSQIYFNAHLKKTIISHLLIILRNRKFIGMSINYTHQSFDIWIIEENIPKDFFDKNFFEFEINNIQSLQSEISRLKVITVKTMVDIIFKKNKIITWEI
ncbi:hypothetical protein [Tenacibaculum finnmarkense]|uniref:hypothetical protein n=1 Tax=Tenacibaculum finnmarkense TaxID=2781243 RepID=UPI001E563EC6|nr:hypothetical protein [Tenacibaculum finnmarkense]MCD8411234.1 hypothetical protein [Tenacibaculum finnmarkense genomovar ulcerans]MCG8206688.1 hypothetical protein [Tenacibaculum finnmarkense genomovar finnmarkense]MCG8722808.1 hypothetical protein [Tenacibaculum finnmarkense]MCG8741199.1 hypothetical protein [Tenacibaculum finnmarkense]MCG8764482.1 hypothetical protein [Tenacibaculum finnmarkense]